MVLVKFTTEEGMVIECPEKAIIALGRRDEANHQQVDVDFAEIGEHGVSRLHAFIFSDDETVTIQDFNSRNGTYLNQQVLRPMQRYPLATGDTLKLGRITLTIALEAIPSQA
ncbi:MAG: FHA domain-containing protein [Chloroflexota bacterium]